MEENIVGSTPIPLSISVSQEESNTKSKTEVSISSSKSKVISESSVWNHFTKIIPPDGSRAKQCTCNYCGKVMGCASEHGTSALKRHLDRCFLYPNNTRDKKQKLLNYKVEESDGKTVTSVLAWKFDQETVRKELARMIITDEMPFNCVEREGFKNFCQAINPKFNLLSRTTVTKDCFALYLEEKNKLKDMFKRNSQRVCLTTDMWTSIQNLGYMCLTAHYIDRNWKLQKRIINFCVVPSPHTGEVISNVLESCLLDWGLEKLSTITVDNACSNDVAIRSLNRRFSKKNGLLYGDFFHIRCCAHVLNLIVKKGLKYCGDSISKVRSVVRYVRSSPARSQQFKFCREHEKIECKKTLCLDVPTRWNSTFLMLQTALVFQKAFECLEERDYNFRVDCKDMIPNEQDWEKAKVLCKFLEVFYKATVKLSGSLYITSNVYFREVYTIETKLIKWSTNADPMYRDMALAMKEKFNKYWDSADKVNLFLVIACILDPRTKLKYVRFCYSDIYPASEVENKIAKVKNVMDDLLKYYQVNESSLSCSEVVNVSTSLSTNSIVNGMNDEDDSFAKFLQKVEEEQSLEVGTELDRYLLESVVKGSGDEFDILYWWKVNSSRFVNLSKMARDILPIPVSTVASESAFSTGGRILDQYRSSLTPQIVESLVCTQDWLRHAPTPANEEDLDDLDNIISDFQKDIAFTSSSLT